MENQPQNLPQYQSLTEASGSLTYITLEDLIEQSYERFIEETSKDNFQVIVTLEEKAITKVKTLLGSKYDVNKIFDPDEPIHNPLLVEIITTITLYRLFKRNAPRKINSQMTEDYNTALKDLEKLATGRLVLDDLPKPTDEDGNVKQDTMYLNISNRNFFI